MSGVLSMLRIESRRSIGLLCFPLLFAAAWWIASRGGMYAETFGPERFRLWLDTSKAVRDTVLFTGPLVAGLSAWMASRNKRRGMGELLSVTPRPSALRDLTIWAGTALWGMAAYTLIAAIFCLLTWRYATWGGPLLGWLLIGLLATVADSALGFAAGHFAPSRFTAPLVAIALFVGHLLPLGAMDYPLSVPLLSPVAYSNAVSVFDVFREVPQAALQQSLWFTGLGATALCAVSLGNRGRSRAAWIALMVSAAVCATGLVTALSTDTGMGMYDDYRPKAVPYEPVCEARTNITVCLHPAYASLLPQAASIANEVAEPLSGIPGAPRRVAQVEAQVDGHSDVKKNVAYFHAFSLMEGDEDGTRQEIASGLVQDGRAMNSGPAPPKQLDGEDLRRCGKVSRRALFDPAWEAQVVVGAWLAKQAGGSFRVYSPSGCSNTDELAASFASLEPDKRKMWLRQNLADLRSGEITLKDLP